MRTFFAVVLVSSCFLTSYAAAAEKNQQVQLEDAELLVYNKLNPGVAIRFYADTGNRKFKQLSKGFVPYGTAYRMKLVDYLNLRLLCWMEENEKQVMTCEKQTNHVRIDVEVKSLLSNTGKIDQKNELLLLPQ